MSIVRRMAITGCLLLAAGCAAAGGAEMPATEISAAASVSSSPFLPQPDSSATVTHTSPAQTEETAPTTAMTETPMNTQTPDPLIITIVYNNIPHDARLKTDWGFAALVARGKNVLLFDTGGNGSILLGNMKILGIDPLSVRDVVISHNHSDHTGGLTAFLVVSARPPVFLLPEFGAAFIQSVKQYAEVVEASPGMECAPGILTTGNVGGSIPEQSLVIRTGKGLVIVTGCSHPGIVRIVERAVELAGGPVHLVMGGFHLLDMSDAQIAAILADFRRLGVQKVAPSHCTGERAIAMFAEEYGEDFLATGAGSILRLEG
ncbi:MAG: MBL fold metallo-hydrolase [Anaerolineales bacterium]|nr:MBL fold metallo-hydrolase [Anaerolineales bacterium]